MDDTQKNVIAVLKEITEVDMTSLLNYELFTSGLIDSMATVQLIMNLEDRCDVTIPISDFKREAWSTPSKIVAQVEALR